MSDDCYEDVRDFHRKFGTGNGTRSPDQGPREVSEEELEFRVKFMKEELKEFIEAMSGDDIAGMADALVDLVYVAMGTSVLLGLPWQQIWDAVQAANMKKVPAAAASDSKRGYAFDVVKPPGWTPPDVGMILVENGWPIRVMDLDWESHTAVDLGERLRDEDAGEGERREFQDRLL